MFCSDCVPLLPSSSCVETPCVLLGGCGRDCAASQLSQPVQYTHIKNYVTYTGIVQLYTGIYWNILSVWEYTASTYVVHTSRAQLVFVLICPFESYSTLVPAGWEVWHVVTTRWLTEEVRKEKNEKPFESTSVMEQMVKNIHIVFSLKVPVRKGASDWILF